MKNPATKRKCIFDFGDEPEGTHNRLSKEHALADWMSKIVPKTELWHQNRFTSRMAVSDDLSLNDARTAKSEGDFLSRTLRIVCKKCNGGWMSVLQNEAKQILAPLIKGTPTSLSESDQATLTAWLTMTTIVSEYRNPLSMSISEGERKEFYTSRRALRHWSYFIALHNGERWHKHCYHHASLLMFTTPLGDKIPIELNRGTKNNAQTTAFGVGHFWGITARFPLNVTFSVPRGIADRIVNLPSTPVGVVKVGTGEPLSDDELDRLTECFVNPKISI